MSEYDFKRAYMEAQAKLQKDIRPMIARSGQYNPEADPPYVYYEYPKLVKLPTGREVVAHTDAEERAYLGKTLEKQPPKIAQVNISDLGKSEPVQVTVAKRGRPKKIKAELPPNLE